MTIQGVLRIINIINDENDEYKPLDSYLRREMNTIINKLKKLAV